MPIYEFLCGKCDEVVEKTFPISDCPITIKCSLCGAKAKKQISKCNWILKGNGDDWPSQQLRRKNEGTKVNEAARKKGYDYWKAKSPKLVKQD